MQPNREPKASLPLHVMDTELTFEIDDRAPEEYCQACQQLGADQASGYKTHRSMPLDTFHIKCLHKSYEEPKWIIMCADCLVNASDSGVTVLKDNETWKQNEAMFIRHTHSPKN